MNANRIGIQRLSLPMALVLLGSVLFGPATQAGAQPAGPSRPGEGPPKPIRTLPRSAPWAPVQDNLPVWGTVPSPNGGYGPNRLTAVAVISASDIWAAGSDGEITSPSPEVQHWNGATWTLVPIPAGIGLGELDGVAAITSSDVWFVGGQYGGGHTIILHWDGTSLVQVANPNPGTFNYLYAAAALAGNDVWAVGEYANGGLSKNLVEHWDGTTWSVVPSPSQPSNYNQLRGVAAISASDVWAVGDYGTKTLTLHWDGTRWRAVPSPSVGFSSLFYAVSAVASNDVWAVGQSGNGTLTAHWDGTKWSLVPAPNPGQFFHSLFGVTAIAANDVWAVGYYSTGPKWNTLALHWDGSTWSGVTSPSPDPTLNQLLAVDADSAGDVWAAGTASGSLVEQWNGTAWKVIPSANAGATDNQLNGISIVSSADIWAVGSIVDQSLTEHWNGTAWTIVPSPNPTYGAPLNDVDAIASNDVWAIGNSGSSQGIDYSTITMHWNGTRWTIVPSPNPGTNSFNDLYAVEGVASNDVWAVGTYWDSHLYSQPLTLHWDGTSWTTVANGCGSYIALYGITALSATDIWAVGNSTICHYDGSQWSVVPSPQPRGQYQEIDYPLQDVSAISANDIWAVGYRVIDYGEYLVYASIAEHWNGSRWALYDNVPGQALYGVKANASNDVWAVGGDGVQGLVVHWDGSTWTTVPSPTPNNSGELLAIDALSARNLWAAGYFYSGGIEQTLIEQAPSTTQGNVQGSTNVGGAIISWIGPTTGSVTADASGNYAVAGLPAGTYSFTATYGGCSPDGATVIVVAGTTTIQDFHLTCAR